MATKKRQRQAQPAATEKPATLRDLLDEGTLGKLKAHAQALKEEGRKTAEEKKKREEEARRAELKRLENDFEFLLNNSKMDWQKYK